MASAKRDEGKFEKEEVPQTSRNGKLEDRQRISSEERGDDREVRVCHDTQDTEEDGIKREREREREREPNHTYM